jgi:hypothetical protein
LQLKRKLLLLPIINDDDWLAGAMLVEICLLLNFFFKLFSLSEDEEVAELLSSLVSEQFLLLFLVLSLDFAAFLFLSLLFFA